MLNIPEIATLHCVPFTIRHSGRLFFCSQSAQGEQLVFQCRRASLRGAKRHGNLTRNLTVAECSNTV